MPVQSTAGALSSKKIPLDTGTIANANYWMLTYFVPSISNSVILGDFVVDNSNNENIYINGRTVYPNSVPTGMFSAQINTYYTLPNVSWQKIQSNSTITGTSSIFASNNKLYNTYFSGNNTAGNAIITINGTNGSDIVQYVDDSNLQIRHPKKIITESNGNYWVFGSVRESNNRFYLNKFSSNNVKLSSIQFAAVGNTASSTFYVKSLDMIQDLTGNLILSMNWETAAILQSFNGLLGFDTSNNSIAWQIYVPYPTNGAINVGIPDSPVIAQDITGNVYSYARYVTGAGVRTFLQKWNSNCSIQYYSKQITLTSGSIGVLAISTDSNNNPMIISSTGTGNNYITKLNSNSGNIIFTRNLRVTGTQSTLHDIQVKNDDMYLLFSRGNNQNRNTIIKLPANGNIPGSGTYPAPGPGPIGNLVYFNSSNVVVVNGSTGVISNGIFTQLSGTNTNYTSTSFTTNYAIGNYFVTNLS